MLKRPWMSQSPAAAWVGAPKDEQKDGSKAVWALDRKVDPLLGRTLTYWPEASTQNGPQTCNNTPELLREHHTLNGRSVRTRFPPEPNGYLHLGHAKSMNMNFSLAFERLEASGVACTRETVFRYDDTNPEAETKEFITSLATDVAWLGWAPHVTTHTSDYFPVFYAMALELIDAGKAYVCHQKSPEIEACRIVAKARAALKKHTEDAPPDLMKEASLDRPKAHESPYRNRSVAENRALFEKMRNGTTAEGECTLRLKMYEEGGSNFNMFDQVAYRVKHRAHPHAGDAWCMYPTYDYTHCIVDALEHVDYSICTLEFETRRESYYWVLDALNLYRPKVFEMSRLNVSHVVLSKRKLTKLVETSKVRGWDDPRMPTISGLRRRGYSAQAINAFCRDVGVTRNENFIEYARLQHFARQDLEERADRRMAVRKPLKVTLVGDAALFKTYAAPNHPTDAKRGTRPLTLTTTVFIEASDFREVDAPDFYGLALNKWARLRYCVCLRCTSVEKEGTQVVGITCEIQETVENDPRGKLHWVSDADAVACELRDYDHLFCVGRVDDQWESQINDKSLIVRANALVDSSVGARPADATAFQFERLGFYAVDPDSTPTKLVFNLTVPLKSGAPVKKEAGVSRKAQQEADRLKKEALKKIRPEDLFRTLAYSAWDADGVPTHTAAGEALSKSLLKKCKKEWAKQKKLYGAGPK